MGGFGEVGAREVEDSTSSSRRDASRLRAADGTPTLVTRAWSITLPSSRKVMVSSKSSAMPANLNLYAGHRRAFRQMLAGPIVSS